MGKRGKTQKKGPRDLSKKIKLRDEDGRKFNDMDDEIDAFHKKRDMIPLDINADVESDEDDDEQPVFDYEGIDGEDDDDDEDDEEDEDEDEDDYSNLKGLAAKIARQQKYLNEKFGGVDDEMLDDADDDDKKKGTVWSSRKGTYYEAENKDFELQSSDEDTPAEEEEEVIRLQKERAELLRDEDFGLQSDDEDDSDEEPTLGEMKVKGKASSKSSEKEKVEGNSAPVYEVKKDLNALSREEQMDVLQSSAPELVGLLDELNDAMDQLETHVKPLLSKVKKADNAKKEGMNYLEVKQLLLLSYCQAITFYLLLKSEGQQVRDHPVIARLVEIKSLLDKMKELDGHIPNGLEEMLHENRDIKPAKKPSAKQHGPTSDLYTELNELAGLHSDKQVSKKAEKAEAVKVPSSEENEKKRKKDKHKDEAVSLESAKMLQYRAALEEKLKLKAASGSIELRTDKSKKQKPKKLTGQLETTDDFDDEAMDLEGTARSNGRSSTITSKVSRIIDGVGKKRKGASGDDDLPERDDLGERRWKHELRVLAGAGVRSMDDDHNHPKNEPDSNRDDDKEGDNENENDDESEDDFYNQVKQKRAAKHAMKAGKYSRNPGELYEPETTVDGKRHITTQIEKNRGLTRPRKKLIKNPRKKYKLKYTSAVKRRQGQVREIKKPKASYDGEMHGINARVSRSIRFKG